MTGIAELRFKLPTQGEIAWRYVDFADDFGAHQRHVYMIPREDFWGRQLPFVPPTRWGTPYPERLIVSRQV